MNWYYVEQGKQMGPVNDEQFNALLQSGTITPDTLVWREGMAEWVPYRRLQDPTAAGTTTTGTQPPAVCSECGKLFPADETIRYGDVRVCANCKPAFLQKIQEGASFSAGVLNYAGFGVRFVAWLIDFIILFVFNQVMQFLVLGAGSIAIMGSHPKPAVSVGLSLFMMAFLLAINICYEALLVGAYGATPGKMALRLKVVTADGAQVSYARAFGRYFAKILSSMTCFIGFIIAAFDTPQRRALHDYICNTRVVAKQG
ncbi:MAG TPA: RDD family protein [Candidatus Sulfotelmatobacter sp.]|nr:RDD family protein [Candidatus Sulfotelmatobacter sp.]